MDISPDRYGIDIQVPTWNYIAVDLIVRLEVLPDHRLRDIIDRLSDTLEAELVPKLVWKSTKMIPEVTEELMRQILPYEFQIEDVQSTWKLHKTNPKMVG